MNDLEKQTGEIDPSRFEQRATTDSPVWQKCPVCEGTGWDEPRDVYNADKCRVCKGKGIIRISDGSAP